MNAWLAIFIGGGVGSVLRFAVSRVLLLVQTKPLFPWANLIEYLPAALLVIDVLTPTQVEQLGRIATKLLDVVAPETAAVVADHVPSGR